MVCILNILVPREVKVHVHYLSLVRQQQKAYIKTTLFILQFFSNDINITLNFFNENIFWHKWKDGTEKIHKPKFYAYLCN